MNEVLSRLPGRGRTGHRTCTTDGTDDTRRLPRPSKQIPSSHQIHTPTQRLSSSSDDIQILTGIFFDDLSSGIVGHESPDTLPKATVRRHDFSLAVSLVLRLIGGLTRIRVHRHAFAVIKSDLAALGFFACIKCTIQVTRFLNPMS